MTNPPDLAALAADPARVADVPLELVPQLIVRLSAVQAALGARLTTPVAGPASEADEMLDVEAAAELVGRSASWLRKHGHEVPGFHQPGGRGTRARWSRRALLAWARPGADC